MGLFASILGHVGDGNLHKSVLYDSTNPEQRAKVENGVHDMDDRALEIEGTCSWVPSTGLRKKASLQQELGSPNIDLMRSIKKALDPHWLMNPVRSLTIQTEGLLTTPWQVQLVH